MLLLYNNNPYKHIFCLYFYMELSKNLGPFNFVYDTDKQNYSNCDINGSFYEVKHHAKKTWCQWLSLWVFRK